MRHIKMQRGGARETNDYFWGALFSIFWTMDYEGSLIHYFWNCFKSSDTYFYIRYYRYVSGL